MSREDLIRKLTSRKFWTAVCSFVALIVLAAGKSEQDAAQITAIIMAGATVMAYILGEGLIDAARLGYTEEDVYDPVDCTDEEEG